MLILGFFELIFEFEKLTLEVVFFLDMCFLFSFNYCIELLRHDVQLLLEFGILLLFFGEIILIKVFTILIFDYLLLLVLYRFLVRTNLNLKILILVGQTLNLKV